MKNYLIILVIVLASCGAGARAQSMSVGQDDSQIPIRDGVEYEIWQTLHSDGMIRKRGLFRRWRPASWTDLYPSWGVESVRQFPREAKMVIALYLGLIPESLLESNDTEKQLSDALGGFSSFAEARAELLAGWQGPMYLAPPFTLTMRFSADMILVNTNIERGGERRRYDKFIVDSLGGVLFIEEPPHDMEDELHAIDYDSELLREEYSYYDTVELNGEKIDGTHYFLNYYLDPENVASVVVGDWTRTVFIEQKDKTSPWFSLSDIDLSRTVTGVDNIEELKKEAEIMIDVDSDDDTNGYRRYYDETMIELSLVERISSGTFDDKTRTPWIVIRLKR